MINLKELNIGDCVCFGEKFGEFGKRSFKVLGIRQDEEGTFIKTDYNYQYTPIEMFEIMSINKLSGTVKYDLEARPDATADMSGIITLDNGNEIHLRAYHLKQAGFKDGDRISLMLVK